jgi:histidinol-phosphate aminotransferase
MDAVSIRAGVAAINDRKYFEDTCQKIIATRERTAKALKELGFTMPDSSANFLFVTHPEHSAMEILSFLRDKGIFVRYFNKPRIDNYLRITVGTDEQMDKMIAVLKEFFGQ